MYTTAITYALMAIGGGVVLYALAMSAALYFWTKKVHKENALIHSHALMNALTHSQTHPFLLMNALAHLFTQPQPLTYSLNHPRTLSPAHGYSHATIAPPNDAVGRSHQACWQTHHYYRRKQRFRYSHREIPWPGRPNSLVFNLHLRTCTPPSMSTSTDS